MDGAKITAIGGAPHLPRNNAFNHPADQIKEGAVTHSPQYISKHPMHAMEANESKSQNPIHEAAGFKNPQAY